jgi:hypothetical protein
MNNLHVLVNITDEVLLNFFQELPKNWANISGLNTLPENKLKDLSWANRPGLGWIKITDPLILDCTYSSDWIEGCKGSLLREVSSVRWEKETEDVFVTVNGNVHIFSISERSKTSLLLRKVASETDGTLTTVFKFNDGQYETLTAAQMISLYDQVTNYIQDCFNVEKDFDDEVSLCTTVDDLVSLNYNINWPSTSLTL